MKTITAKMLEEKRACADQVALFKKAFPRGCRLTPANVKKALAVGLDVGWAVDRFATKPRKVAYFAAIQSHYDAYNAAIQSHHDAYNAAIKTHLDAYDAAIKPHRDAYNAAIKPHWDAYLAAIKPHWDAYLAAIKPHQDAYRAAITKEVLKALLGEDDP